MLYPSYVLCRCDFTFTHAQICLVLHARVSCLPLSFRIILSGNVSGFGVDLSWRRPKGWPRVTKYYVARKIVDSSQGFRVRFISVRSARFGYFPRAFWGVSTLYACVLSCMHFSQLFDVVNAYQDSSYWFVRIFTQTHTHTHTHKVQVKMHGTKPDRCNTCVHTNMHTHACIHTPTHMGARTHHPSIPRSYTDTNRQFGCRTSARSNRLRRDSISQQAT
jgi:hypothetical protein